MPLRYRTNGPEYDFPECIQGANITYIIASTPRCGSNMLQRALWRTGIAGFPEEYFAPAYVSDFAERWPDIYSSEADVRALDVYRYVRRLIETRTSPNGVFGVKAHPSHMVGPVLADGDIDALLRSPRYIWIQRADRVRQAISYYRAERSGVWIVDGVHLPTARPNPNRVDYSFDGIARYLSALDSDVAYWDDYFGRGGVAPLVISYEDLVADYEGVVSGCLTWLGLRLPPSLAGPGIERQADSLTDEWYERFVFEGKGLM